MRHVSSKHDAELANTDAATQRGEEMVVLLGVMIPRINVSISYERPVRREVLCVTIDGVHAKIRRTHSATSTELKLFDLQVAHIIVE